MTGGEIQSLTTIYHPEKLQHHSLNGWSNGLIKPWFVWVGFSPQVWKNNKNLFQSEHFCLPASQTISYVVWVTAMCHIDTVVSTTQHINGSGDQQHSCLITSPFLTYGPNVFSVFYHHITLLLHSCHAMSLSLSVISCYRGLVRIVESSPIWGVNLYPHHTPKENACSEKVTTASQSY